MVACTACTPNVHTPTSTILSITTFLEEHSSQRTPLFFKAPNISRTWYAYDVWNINEPTL
ncbi:hypothetical protein NC653_017339 [Populus alba x Populus x berolinensis]|uniref:Uncharacterized protein n=1 Tax=Populus alba x Populus x berolinensis TaxID=444605 RepID=A0AAD6QQR4_9ROSI|nr:hypothetical protein NC653_017339 [Populus alba x Populus x berolinensis]